MKTSLFKVLLTDKITLIGNYDVKPSLNSDKFLANQFVFHQLSYLATCLPELASWLLSKKLAMVDVDI